MIKQSIAFYLSALAFAALVIFIFILTMGYLYGDEVEDMADAIFKAEGGYEATYLYGIRSIKYENEAEARQICLNSIRNNIKRWEKAGKPEDFIIFMSRRYAPIGASNDPKNLNKNWVENVKFYLDKL